MAQHNDFGREAESLAKTWLEEHGYEICDENWRHGKDEIDLVVYRECVLVFVEVKARSRTDFGLPDDAVDLRKQKLLARAADAYVYAVDYKGEIRFDIISVLQLPGTAPQIRHHIDAFWPGHRQN
ncbi:MAG: YraN family protein [Mucilaginibacter polytrichastri]|nr:YraN family protein [Mucilaginibacter polytrichastri]